MYRSEPAGLPAPDRGAAQETEESLEPEISSPFQVASFMDCTLEDPSNDVQFLFKGPVIIVTITIQTKCRSKMN